VREGEQEGRELVATLSRARAVRGRELRKGAGVERVDFILEGGPGAASGAQRALCELSRANTGKWIGGENAPGSGSEGVLCGAAVIAQVLQLGMRAGELLTLGEHAEAELTGLMLSKKPLVERTASSAFLRHAELRGGVQARRRPRAAPLRPFPLRRSFTRIVRPDGRPRALFVHRLRRLQLLRLLPRLPSAPARSPSPALLTAASPLTVLPARIPQVELGYPLTAPAWTNGLTSSPTPPLTPPASSAGTPLTSV
jgi:hypothetical protein